VIEQRIHCAITNPHNGATHHAAVVCIQLASEMVNMLQSK